MSYSHDACGSCGSFKKFSEQACDYCGGGTPLSREDELVSRTYSLMNAIGESHIWTSRAWEMCLDIHSIIIELHRKESDG